MRNVSLACSLSFPLIRLSDCYWINMGELMFPKPLHLDLPARFEIRPLDHKHVDWLRALTYYSCAYEDKRLSHLYVGSQAKMCLEMFQKHRNAPKLAEICANKLSFGIFDTEFDYKRQESRENGGKLYWPEMDPTKPDLEENGEEDIFAAMDFPLVGFANGIDQTLKLPMEPDPWPYRQKLNGLAAVGDPRPKGSWEATEAGQTVLRAGTLTRKDYRGRGLSKALAHFYVEECARLGFRAIQMASMHPAVTRVWTTLPSPHSSRIVYEGDWKNAEVEDENGTTLKLWGDCPTIYSIIWVDLVRSLDKSQNGVDMKG